MDSSDVGVEQPEPRRQRPWQFGVSRFMLLTLAIAVALWLQGGIWGTIRRKLGADLFPVRRRLVE